VRCRPNCASLPSASRPIWNVVFAWRSHREVALERLTVQGVFAATDRLALCLAGPRLRRTAPTGHSHRPRFHALPAARFGESPFMAYRTPMRAATTVTKICAEAFLLGCRQALGAPRSESVQPSLLTIWNLAGTSCVGILHFRPFGSALGTLFDSPTEALHVRASLRAQGSLLRSPETWGRRKRAR
jgi:hypothetical protein